MQDTTMQFEIPAPKAAPPNGAAVPIVLSVSAIEALGGTGSEPEHQRSSSHECDERCVDGGSDS